MKYVAAAAAAAVVVVVVVVVVVIIILAIAASINIMHCRIFCYKEFTPPPIFIF
jgi:hypothetical protein